MRVPPQQEITLLTYADWRALLEALVRLFRLEEATPLSIADSIRKPVFRQILDETGETLRNAF
ncbi:hypothetical protein, partial [Pseudomonas aeruginosa]|uniref:hypothetical protein n=1 Tax=Pseudomonas aeruginosa TaxID=287 RepID=UPI003CF58084